MANKNSTGKDEGKSTSKKLTKKQEKNIKEATERYDVCFSLGVKDGFLDGTVYGDRDEMAVMLLSFFEQNTKMRELFKDVLVHMEIQERKRAAMPDIKPEDIN